MRGTTLLNRALNLAGVRVTGVDPGVAGSSGPVVIDVSLRRRKLACPACSFTTRARYDVRAVDSSWRHLDLGGRVCEVRMRRRRLDCPTHGVMAEGVPFARPGARFTADFEDLVVWLVTRSDKTTVATFARVLDITRGVTSLIISHRFSSIRRADRIVVLDGGRIRESGSHDELVASGDLYADMFSIQARRFEASGDRA